MRHWHLLPLVWVLAACGEKQEAPHAQQATAVVQTMEHTAGVAVQAGGDANVTVNNYQKSQDYQDLLAKRGDALENVQKYPDDAKFRQILATAEQNLENFKRDVLKLAEEINKFPINTERMKQAVALFNAQQYAEARRVLDAGEITQEQDALLAKQQRLQEEQATITAQLDDKANEWLLKAQLTAIDYSLGEQRIAQTSRYFEKALKSGRTPDRLFAYAKFLQENNQYRTAETLYTEALTLFRQLAKDNPAVYLPTVATTLNNLGLLVSDDSQRRKEAETLYTEALTLLRQLAKDNPAVYLPTVALMLNNLGSLVAADSQRRKEAETLYTEALTLRRQLAKDNPAVYLPDVANTLAAFGIAYLGWNALAQALPLLQESAQLFAPLAEQAPGVFGEKHDIVLQLIEEAKAANP